MERPDLHVTFRDFLCLLNRFRFVVRKSQRLQFCRVSAISKHFSIVVTKIIRSKAQKKDTRQQTGSVERNFDLV